MLWRTLFGLLLVSASLAASEDPTRKGPAAEDPAATAPSEALTLSGCTDADLTIGRVEVVAKDIFDLDDPAEDRRAYRWADRLHRTTREGVIRQVLLFHSGDSYSKAQLEESERLLRARHAFADVTVEPVDCHDGLVDIEVTTHDTWTLGGGVSFGRSGGENSVRFELSDSNFLGSGKEVLLRYDRNVDRSGYEMRYFDRSLFGTHNELWLSYFDKSDGQSYLLRGGRPFYSLDSHWALGGELFHSQKTDPIYRRGQIVDGWSHIEDRTEIAGGWLAGHAKSGVRRFRLGFTRDRHEFVAIPPLLADATGDSLSSIAPRVTTQGELPSARDLAYPWIGFEVAPDHYLEGLNLDQIGRTEDRYLGTRFSARLGYSTSFFGGDESKLIASARFSSSWRPRPRALFETGAVAQGRWGSEPEDVLVSGFATLHWRDFGEQLFYLHMAADWASNLDRDHQLLLGGDSGLRGYPLRFQDGDRRFLITAEQRVFTHWYPWHLFRVGGAAFVDVGRAWFADGRPDTGDGLDGILGDIGLGLRLGLSRSGRGNVLHIDVAMPLNRSGSLGGLQWLISTEQSF